MGVPVVREAIIYVAGNKIIEGAQKDSAICCLASWEQVLGILQGSLLGEYMDHGSKL